MADPKDKSEDEGAIVEKEELVEFLTSSGKVRRGLAESLYDQGLNTWELLVEGDEEKFISFKGVGKKTAEELMIMGVQKKEELSSPPEPARDIRDVLSEVPRVNQGVIDSLVDAGFDDVYRISAVDPSELREVQGVGPKLSEKIVEACREEAEKHPQSVAGVEEAMPLPADEEPSADKGDGFLSKLIGKVKAFFSTEKEGPSTPEVDAESKEEPVAEDETPSDDKDEESADAETLEEKPSEDEKKPEEPLEGEKESEPDETVEEKTEGEASDEEPAAEDKKEEEPIEEPSEDEKEPPDEETEESPKEEPRSIWAKIKGLFSGKEEEEPSEEKPSEEEPKKEEAPESTEEEDGTPTDDKDEEEPPEEKPSEEDPSEKEPVKEKPSEKEPVKEEPSDEKPSEEEPRLEIKDIHHIPGVDKKTADLLLSSGYMNLDELREAVPEDLMMIEGIDEDTAKFIYEVLRK